jgi:hypothetical protein
MRFLFINEGSRGEVDSEIGSENDFHQILFEFILLKYKGSRMNGENVLIEDEDTEFMKMRFGGLSDLECFCEVIFDEEYSYKVYILNDKNEIKSEEYKLVNYVNDKNYDIININKLS